MNKASLIAVSALLLPIAAAAQDGNNAAPGKNTAKQAAKAATSDKKSDTFYVLGYMIGHGLDTFMFTDTEYASMLKGLKDAAYGKKPKVELEAKRVDIEALVKDRTAKRASAEKAKGKDYLAKMAKENGASTTASGIVMVPMKDGTGASPSAADTVKVHYTGMLTDGKVFDSSVKRGTPETFSLQGIIPCWTEALQKMKVGGKAKLGCPSSTAYGDQGRPSIPGGSTLVFEVELLEVVHPAKEEAAPAAAVPPAPAAKEEAKPADKK